MPHRKALEEVRHSLRPIQRLLKAVVQLFPFEELTDLRRGSEQRRERVVVDSVALFFERVDFNAVLTGFLPCRDGVTPASKCSAA